MENNLEKRIRELERLMSFHKHYGYDKSSIIDGNIKLKSQSILKIGTSFYGNQNLFLREKKEFNRLVMTTGQGTKMEHGSGTENTQLVLDNYPENYTWKGNWATATAYIVGDAVRSNSYSWYCKLAHTSGASTEPTVGGDYATKWQLLNFYSFYYGFRPPLYSGPQSGDTIGVTNGGTTITDTKQGWGVNHLADAYVSVTGSTIGLETYKITSNTATVITINGTWGTTDSDVVYVVFRPMYFGAANYPWKRIYLMDDIRFGKGSSGGSDVIYVKYGSGTPESSTTANIGSLYLRTDGSSGSTLYVKESGTGNTGWVAQGGGGFTSKARAYRVTSNQTIGTASSTKVQFNAESYDINTEYDKDTNYRFTAKAAGYYQIDAQVQWGSSVDQSRHDLWINKNGSTAVLNKMASSGGASFGQNASTQLYLAVNDYIEIEVYQTTGSNKDIILGENLTFLSIHRLS